MTWVVRTRIYKYYIPVDSEWCYVVGRFPLSASWWTTSTLMSMIWMKEECSSVIFIYKRQPGIMRTTVWRTLCKIFLLKINTFYKFKHYMYLVYSSLYRWKNFLICFFYVPFYIFRSSLYNIPYMYMKPVLTAEQADKINKQTIYPCPIFMNKVCTDYT